MEEQKQEKSVGRIVRILSRDIEGKMNVYAGLATIKGISWAMSNALCKALEIDKRKKIGALTDAEIKRISEFVKNPQVPLYVFNRRNDFETGKNKHLTGSELELQHEFDIKRLKKIKSYKGIRHGLGLTVRGQRTRSHFRKNRRKGSGIKKKTKTKESK